MQEDTLKKMQELALNLEGQLFYDNLHKRLYATDASVYRQVPLAVAYPKTVEDIKLLILFAKTNLTSIIPRTAGTSLAGQCVGEGIVVDVSKHFTKIISLNQEAKTVTVQPGVIRDDLNRFLKPYGLFFGPNTSTSNRCMIGGMVGNNSSGTTSIQYGVTRDKVIQIKALLSDASEVTFNDLTNKAFAKRQKLKTLEGKIYKKLDKILAKTEAQEAIKQEFPHPNIHRRNTGYALDVLFNTSVFKNDAKHPINISKLLTGSEGTLAFTTEVTLKLDELPPKYGVMLAVHFDSIEGCLDAVVPAMKFDLYSCEMMDKVILDCTLNNREQQKNRFFIQGDPQAILMLEIRDDSKDIALSKAEQLIGCLKKENAGYAYPLLYGEQIEQAVALRKAGLGLLGNIVGDRKAVACIEDTAVCLQDLSAYIKDFTALMHSYNQDAVYYAHAGAGELHLRPILNLKSKNDVKRFKQITTAIAQLVKSYKGSLSGEHGDGIVRSEFIPLMVGKENYKNFKKIKKVFDPENIFNPGKIVYPQKMNKNLRYKPGRNEPDIETKMNFEDAQGILRLAENCNGSGDCRKPFEAGGVMCPSYRATRNEKDTTRARANALREFLTTSDHKNPFDHRELKEVFDLCVSCKACATECPSNVDVAALKAEFQYQYKKNNGSSLRTRAFAYNAVLNSQGAKFVGLSNTLFKNKYTSHFIKRLLHIAPERSLPQLASKRLSKRLKKILKNNPTRPIKTVYLFIDEFTDLLDTEIGVESINLLQKLNYAVATVNNAESGRSFISKGFLSKAQHIANKNIELYAQHVDANTPLVGIEPSAILSFRDEYIRLAEDTASAKIIAQHTFTIEEFISNEIKQGNIQQKQFTAAPQRIKIHVHCHQKALSSVEATFIMLNIPKNYKPTLITSGCCGMAGSFGYEEEHYTVSMQMGEQGLFPAVRKAECDTLIVAAGTSCRHQIADATQRKALHPAQVLLKALK